MVHFQGTEYRSHTSCMTEAQKYQGHLYRGEKKKGQQQQQQQQQKQGDKRKSMQGQDKAMVPVPKPYVEDAPEDGESQHAVAVIDVPPRAPTPPPAAQALPADNVNVFDFLVQDATPKAATAAPAVGAAPPRKMLERESSSMYVNHPNDSQYSQYSNGDGSTYLQRGFSYGDAPVQPTFQRYDSQGSLLAPPEAYATPAPKKEKKDKSDKSDKKRKRHHVDDLDLSAAKRPASRDDEPMTDAPAPPPSSAGRVLHSGLTGGLSRLVTDPDFYADRIDAGPTPISPLKRTKRSSDSTKEKDSHKRKSSHGDRSSTRTVSHTSSKPSDESSTSRRHTSRRHQQHSPSSSPEPRPKTRLIESGRASSVQPSASNQVALQGSSRAELFMSFVNKGPESERGVSINKALKRYHRERGLRVAEDKEDEDKELWKEVRVRRNERGEVVLFF